MAYLERNPIIDAKHTNYKTGVNYYVDFSLGDWCVSNALTYGRMTTTITKDGVIGKSNNKLIDIVYGEYDRVIQ